MDVNPSAARSLEEGMEETLTVHKLGVPEQLRRTHCCTNVIESAFSIVETAWRNVKRWRPGDPIERWVGSGCRAAVPPGDWSSPDSAAAVFDGQHRLQEIDCERSRGRVAYESRESLTLNDDPAVSFTEECNRG